MTRPMSPGILRRAGRGDPDQCLQAVATWGQMTGVQQCRPAERPKMIRHIVALRFKAGTTAQAKEAIFADLAALQPLIPGVLDFHAGPNVSVEPLSRGFDDVFWFDFRDAAARDAYLIHPAHKAAGARILAATEGGLDGVFVFDIAVA